MSAWQWRTSPARKSRWTAGSAGAGDRAARPSRSSANRVVQRGAVADGDVVDLVARLGAFAGGGQQVGLDGVGDVAEVAAGFAVAVDVDRLALEQRGSPLGDHGGVGAVGVLAGAEDVEVAQADGCEAVAAGEDVGVEFVDVLGDGVGAERLADACLRPWAGRGGRRRWSCWRRR